MGQLENLRELSIAQSDQKKKKGSCYYAVVIQFDRDPNDLWDIKSLHIKIIWSLMIMC